VFRVNEPETPNAKLETVMVYKYVVVLKNLQNRYIDLVGLLLSIFSAFCFARELTVANKVGVAYLIGLVFVMAVVIYNLAQSYRKRKVYYSRALLIAALVWMKMPYWQWLAFVFIILALLEYQAKYAVEIGFSDEQIVINSLFKRKYRWDQFSNIVLKDGIITLDFVNNRLLQREIEDDEEEDEADEEEFNEYCQSRLSAVTQ
jgi:hypothetical protein